MRTFHIGGAATKVSEENRTYLHYPVLIKEINGTTVTLENGDVLYTRKGYVILARALQQIPLAKSDKVLVEDGSKVVPGDVVATHGKSELQASEIGFATVLKEQIVVIAQDQKIDIRTGAKLLVGINSVVPAEESIAVFDPFSEPIIAEVEGTVKYQDIFLGTTLKEEVNEDTGNIDKKITENSLETLQPLLRIVDDEGEEVAAYYLPGNAYLNVEDGEKVHVGRTLAKLLKESVKTRDITGGLPRVGELFEARRPKSPAILAKISGTINLKGIVKGKRQVEIVDSYADEDGENAKVFKHLVPMGKHLLVRDGDLVEAGEPLCDGAVDPHDILDILGENELQSYLVDEVQEVYRMQGVVINDKHIGVIVRQMMRKVEISQVGDTNFIYGQQVDKYKFHEENNKVVREGGQPAVAKPLLLGITRASLNIDSFLSAASFQETTKVLTNAAIAGSVDKLRGLKENVVIGHPIPAGTGMRAYKNVRLFDETSEDLDASIQQILEQRRAEEAAEEAAGAEKPVLSFGGTGIEQALSEAGIFSESDGDEEE
jgi:DNA-directed RNA polymerase subunit beta'